MSILENLLAQIEGLNTNVAALTAALQGAGITTAAAAGTVAAAKEEVTSKPAAAGKGGKGKATAPAKTEPKHTVEEVAAAAVRVKDELGTPAAQELIKSAGKADKLKEIKPENFDAFVAACEEALAAEPETVEAGDDL